jgi:hypothetical protein
MERRVGDSAVACLTTRSVVRLGLKPVLQARWCRPAAECIANLFRFAHVRVVLAHTRPSGCAHRRWQP